MSNQSVVRAVVALCFAIAVLEGFDIQALGVAAPKLAPEFGLSPAQMGWVFTCGSLGLVLGSALGGRIADRWGRRPTLIAAVLCFGVFTLATTLAHNGLSLLILRALAGLGFGAAQPNMIAIAADISAARRRSFITAAMACGMPMGGGASALLTQLVAPGYDWRLLFIVGGTLPLLVVPLLLRYLPETLPALAVERGRQDIVNILFGEGRAVPTVLLGVLFFLALSILYLVLNWLPTLVVGKGLSKAVAPQASMAFNFASVAGALLLGRAVDRWGVRWTMPVTFAGLMVALLGLSAASGIVQILFWSAAAGFLLLGAVYALYGVAAGYYPSAIRGAGAGVIVAIGRTGSVVGPLVAGLMLSAGATPDRVLVYLAPVAAVTALVVLALTFFRNAD